MEKTKTMVEIGITYYKELLLVDKTLIYNAITALETALTYMPHVQTSVPKFQLARNQDVSRMESTLGELRKLGIPLDTSKPQA